MCVSVYVCPLISAASHIGITKERYERVYSSTGIVFNFADFPENASFKSYGAICLPRAAKYGGPEVHKRVFRNPVSNF